ncbi:MAG TPA: TonB-dependent receptor [Opitutaceae bacterium]|nr:TonB-dependent receptor [Opitutaceae bacterium]
MKTSFLPFAPRTLLAPGLCLLVATTSSLYAQSRDPLPEEPVELDPFSVTSSRDYGYRATNASTATGSGQAVRDTPMSIAILTRELLEDKGLTEIRDALRDVTGMSAASKEELDIYSRGFDSVVKVDGAEEAGAALTTYNVERVEIVKGAVSALQGRASAGGVVNLISRKPKFKQATSLSATYGSFDYKLGKLSVTGPLIDKKLAYLVGYSRLDKKGWVDYTYRKEDSLQLGLEIRPLPRLSINLDFQYFERNENPQTHLTFTHPAFLAAELEAQTLYDAKGLARPASYPRIAETTVAWLTRTPGYGPNEPTEIVNVNEIMYPSGFRANPAGPQSWRYSESRKGSIEAKYKIASWLDWRSVYYESDGNSSSAILATFRAAGGLTIRERGVYNRTLRRRSDTSHEAVSSFDVLGTRHRLLVGFQYRGYDTKNQNLNGPITTYNPRTAGPRMIMDEIMAANPNGFPTVPFAPSYERSYYFSDQISAFGEKVHVFLGGRHSTRSQRTSSENPRVSDGFTPQGGVAVRVPGLEQLTVYASYGESWRPNFVLDGFGNVIDPITEKNHEAGVKMDFLDGRISGSASIYQLDQKNVPLRDHAREADLGISPLYTFAGAARSSGAEFDLTLTPMRNYQVVLGYSRIWEARTLEAEDVRMINVRRQNAPTKQFSLWNKYTFVDGPLKNFYAGFGLRWTGEIRIHGSWSVPLYTNNVWDGNALLGYRFKLRKLECDLSGRVDNIFDKFYYEQTFRPVEPRRAYVTASFKF